jgi:hypothetical protein
MFRFLSPESEDLSLSLYQVSGGLVFGDVHLYAISFFAGPIVELDSKAGLHSSWKGAQVNALLRINLTIGAGLSHGVTFGQIQKQDLLTPKFQIGLVSLLSFLKCFLMPFPVIPDSVP